MRVWFNKTFSSVHKAIKLIRLGDTQSRYQIVASNTTSRSLTQLHADDYQQEPSKLSDSDYLAWCLQFCQTQRIDILIPGKATSNIIAAADEFLANGTRVMAVASPHHLTEINNKANFYQHVNCPEAPPPATRLFSSLAEFEAAYAELSPHYEHLCIKPAVSVYGIGFRKIRTDCNALQLFRSGNSHQIDLVSLRSMLSYEPTFPTLLLMEFLGGDEYSVDCLADHGVLKCAVARCKRTSKNPGQRIEQRADIDAACQRIIQQYQLNGYINIQFRQGEHGLSILEVNPRLSGGIGMTYFSGVNLPYLGLLGFDLGYEAVSIPAVRSGCFVTETNFAVELA